MTWTLTAQIALLMLGLFHIIGMIMTKKFMHKIEERQIERQANLEYHNLMNLKNSNEDIDKMKKDMEDMNKRVDALTLRSGFKL